MQSRPIKGGCDDVGATGRSAHDDDRIERYMRIFEKEDVKKLETGVKVIIEKDEWQLLP